MQRYVDILTDSGFKAVFGEQRNREVLIDMLNAFLPDGRHVRDIEYSATELPGFTLSNKSVRLDLRCTGEDGRQFIVEVQCYGDVPDETIFCIFVELNRFSKSLEECTGELDEWCHSLRHVGTMTEIPDRLKKEPFKRFFRACEIAKFDTDTKLIYKKDMITERDYYNIINTARKTGMSAGMERGLQKGLQQGLQRGMESGLKKGREEGLQKGMESGLKKGREEGMIEGQHRIAKTMKAMGMTAEVIAKATGLPEEEIAEL